jgi:hypothetical protein
VTFLHVKFLEILHRPNFLLGVGNVHLLSSVSASVAQKTEPIRD